MSSFLTGRGPRMNSMWTPELEEEFVAMMETKPELFDTTEMNFSNKTAKMNAWLEMAEHLGLSGKQGGLHQYRSPDTQYRPSNSQYRPSEIQYRPPNTWYRPSNIQYRHLTTNTDLLTPSIVHLASSIDHLKPLQTI